MSMCDCACRTVAVPRTVCLFLTCPALFLTCDVDCGIRQAVRQRFAFARSLLQEGTHSVLMHDADVFFQGGGLPRLLAFLENQSSMDLVVAPNGRHAGNYDNLNWGMMWLSGSNRTLALLDCALAEWDQAAFRGVGSYYRRSQPRMNHLVETHFENTPRSNQMRVCKVPSKLNALAYTHMTDFSTVRAKLICAVSQGLLAELSPQAIAQTAAGKRPRSLAYVLPGKPTVGEQQRALGSAIRLATALGRALALPQAWHRHKKEVPFCSLYHAGSFPPLCTVVPPILKRCDASSYIGLPEAIHAVRRFSAGGSAESLRQNESLRQKDMLCIGFEVLVELAREISTPVIGTCPSAPVKCVHAAHAKRQPPTAKARKLQGRASGRVHGQV